MSNVNIHLLNGDEPIKFSSNLYQNVTDIELEVSDGEGYKSQDEEYVIHDDIENNYKETNDQNTLSKDRDNNIDKRYDHNNVYLQQIPQRNKCKVQINDLDVYEHENQQISENPNQVFVTLAKRKSHGRYTSFFLPLFKTCSGQKCVWLVVGVFLTILILATLSIVLYVSPTKIKADCKTSNATHMAILGGFKIKVLDRNKKCVFPFRYKKKVYHTCTNDKACSTCYWCGTQFNVSFSSGWGMCNNDCPKETDDQVKTTRQPQICTDEKDWCKNAPKKKCDDRIYDFDDARDDLYKHVCKKLCNNCLS